MKASEKNSSSFWSNMFKSPTVKSELEEVLLSMPPFEKLNKNNIKNLMNLMHNRVYKANEVVFHQGEPGAGLYVIVKGEVLISMDQEDEHWDLALLGRGDFFGELALLDDSVRSASAIALKDTQLSVIFKPDLDEFVETYSKDGINILRGISQIIATRLRGLNQDYFTLYNQTRNR